MAGRTIPEISQLSITTVQLIDSRTQQMLPTIDDGDSGNMDLSQESESFSAINTPLPESPFITESLFELHRSQRRASATNSPAPKNPRADSSYGSTDTPIISATSTPKFSSLLNFRTPVRDNAFHFTLPKAGDNDTPVRSQPIITQETQGTQFTQFIRPRRPRFTRSTDIAMRFSSDLTKELELHKIKFSLVLKQLTLRRERSFRFGRASRPTKFSDPTKYRPTAAKYMPAGATRTVSRSSKNVIFGFDESTPNRPDVTTANTVKFTLDTAIKETPSRPTSSQNSVYYNEGDTIYVSASSEETVVGSQPDPPLSQCDQQYPPSPCTPATGTLLSMMPPPDAFKNTPPPRFAKSYTTLTQATERDQNNNMVESDSDEDTSFRQLRMKPFSKKLPVNRGLTAKITRSLHFKMLD